MRSNMISQNYTASSFETHQHHQLLSLLKPVEMNEYSRKNCLPTTQLDMHPFDHNRMDDARPLPTGRILLL